LFSDLFN